MLRHRIGWALRVAVAIGVLVSLGLGTGQAAVTSSSASASCVNCSPPGEFTFDCVSCCGGPAFCTTTIPPRCLC